MTHSNVFPHISKDVQYKLKIAGVTAIVLGTGWCIHKYYQEYYNPQNTISNLSDDTTDIIDTIENDEIESKEAEELNNIYSPEIKVYDAVYGISRIELDNVNAQQTEFQMEIKDKNNIELLDFNINNIQIDETSNKTYIHCRLPLRLNDYSIEFRIRCKVKDFWSSFSTSIHLNVPSSLISRNFQINETVTFVPKGSNWGSKGKIVKVLDSDCDLYVVEEFDWRINHSKEHIVHYSRIYRNGPYLYNVINANHNTQNEMDKTVLFGQNNKNSIQTNATMAVFNVLSKIYENYAAQMKIDHDIHYVFIGRLVAKNVTDFLLYSQSIKHNLVNCMMQYNHRFMKLVPVWINSVRNSISLNEMGAKVTPNGNASYWCDLCGMEISRYDYIYRCDTTITDRHFFCLKCVWDIIEQHKQLTQFLKQYLRKYLYDVCIEEISSFVCGSVVYS